MVRRTREAAAATRERLLDAAERVFRDRGVTRTSLSEVAAEAGVTRGAVYWHFRDKADLFVAMCERATSPMDALVEQANARQDGSPLASLRSLCVDALVHLSRDPHTHAVFEIMFHKSELAGELTGVADRHDRDCAHARACVEAVFRRAVAAGELPPDTDIALAAFAMYAYVTGIMHEWTLEPGARDLRVLAPALVDTFIAGLAAKAPRLDPARPGAAARHDVDAPEGTAADAAPVPRGSRHPA